MPVRDRSGLGLKMAPEEGGVGPSPGDSLALAWRAQSGRLYIDLNAMELSRQDSIEA